MKAISAVLLGYALVLAFVGTGFAKGTVANASGGASSNTHPEGVVEVRDLKVVQGHAEYSADAGADENAGASMWHIAAADLPAEVLSDVPGTLPHRVVPGVGTGFTTVVLALQPLRAGAPQPTAASRGGQV